MRPFGASCTGLTYTEVTLAPLLFALRFGSLSFPEETAPAHVPVFSLLCLPIRVRKRVKTKVDFVAKCPPPFSVENYVF